ncbi:MAG: radical SAM protein [Candidatus Krumholzibacteriota bacterium]|nr:radical SAM protein [Candidatus Krumholzibacteriota bacterium]
MDDASDTTDFEPAYLALHRSGELRHRGERLYASLSSCELCPRRCRVDRLAGERGFCGATADLVVFSAHPHFGEETPLVGTGGSGTVFFSYCGLRCVFCFNHEISWEGEGTTRRIEDLASMMLGLEGRGCHNINTVTPTHYLPHILLALDLAAGKGLRLPVVYNTCGWERMEILAELDGVVDVYLPDYKYADASAAERFSSGARSYPAVTQRALVEMDRQVGVARPDTDGLIRRGLMIRHLVMPNDAAATERAIKWIAANLPGNTRLNLMSQYRPAHRANEYPEIDRPLTRAEYARAVRAARDAGLANVDIQGY